MAINGGKIEFGVSFRADKTGLNEVKQNLQEIKDLTAEQLINFNPSLNLKEAKQALSTVKIDIGNIEEAFKKAFDLTTGVTNISKLSQNLKSLDLSKIASNFNKIGPIGSRAFAQIANKAMTTNIQFKETNNILDRMGKTFGNTIRWGISSKIINTFTGSIQQAWGYVKHLDTSLNDIRIVTDKSADEMDRFAVSANKAAKELGAATTDYTEAALIYYQQGLSDEEAQARAETTIKAANVTGQTGREVSEELTAVWNGYKVTAEETELYVDKLAAVAATTASNLEELSTGMSKVASAASNMGVNVDQLNGMLSTIISVTRQAPENAGTALKTIFARMEDLKIDGSDEDGVKLGEVSSTLDEVGVHILDTEGNLRDLGGVIEEVGNKWNDWTDAQQSAIAQALAGKRQYNNLLALFDNWDKYNTAVQTSEDSVGTLQHQQDIYMESTEAHLQKLETTWESFYNNLLDTDSINDLIDGLTTVIDKFSSLIKVIGGGKGALLGFSSVLLNVFNKQFSQSLGDVITKIKNSATNVKQLKAEIELTSKFANEFASKQGVNLSSNALNEIIGLKKETQKYYSVMSNEEIEAMNQLVQKAGQVAIIKDKWEANGKAVEDYVKSLAKAQLGNTRLFSKDTAGSNYDKVSRMDFFNSNEKTDEIAQRSIDLSIDSAEKMGQAYGSAADAVTNFQNVMKDSNSTSKEQAEAHQAMKDSLSNLETVWEDFINLSNLSQEDQEKLQQSYDKTIDRVNKLIDAYNSGKKVHWKTGDAVTTALKNQGSVVVEVTGKVKELGETYKQAFSDETREKFKSSIDVLNQYKGKISALTNEFGTRLMTKGVVDLAGGITSLSFGIQQLTNTYKIWQDENASFGEKILSTVTSLSMSLPMLISGFNKIGPGLATLKTGIQDVVANMIIEKQITDGLISSTQAEAIASEIAAGASIQEAAANNQVTLSLGPQTSELILNTIATKASAAATKALSSAWSFLISVIKAHPFIAAAAVITSVVSVINKFKTSAKEAAAETAKMNLELAENKLTEISEYVDKIDELNSKYDELSNQYKNQEISLSNLRSQIYELCQSYDIEIDSLEVLTASYEELEDIIKRVHTEATEAKAEAQKDVINSKKESIIAENEKYMSENYDTIADGIKNRLSTSWMNQAIYNETGLDIMNTAGDVDWEMFYSTTEENREIITSILQDYSDWNGRAEDALNAIRQSQATWDEIQSEEKSYQQTVAENLFEELYSDSEISNVQDYNDIKEKLTNQLVEELDIAYEDALELAEKQLNSKEDIIKVNASIELAGQLKNSYNESEEELGNKISELSDSDITFLTENIDLAKSYDSLEDFLEEYKDVREALETKDNILDIQVVLSNADGTEFKTEDIEELFKNEDFVANIGVTQEEFENKNSEQQMALLLTYYSKANELEKDYHNNKKQDLEEENKVKQENLEKEIKDIDKLKDRLVRVYQVDETVLDEGYYNTINNSIELAAQRLNEVNGADIFDSEGINQALEKLASGATDFTDAENDMLNALVETTGKSREQLIEVYRSKKAYEGWAQATENTEYAGKSYNKVVKELTNQLNNLEKVVSDVDLSEMDWESFDKGLNSLKEFTTEGIDNLQSSYSSLKSIVESYNETQTLSMDNLQTILDMDTAYLSALQIENGQMSINTSALQKIALARLDEAEAEAYLTAMEELGDENRKEEIEGLEKKNIALQDISATAAASGEAANGSVEDWNKYWAAVLHEEGKTSNAYTDQVGDALRAKLQAIEAVRNQILSGNFDTTMSSSSSSSSTDEAETLDYLEREEDIYHNINNELDNIETKLSRIQKIDEHSWGASAQEALKKEGKLLDEQIAKYKEKAELQVSDLSSRRKSLEDQGFTFNDEGSMITNSEEKLNTLYAEYNAMVDKYNAMSAEDQELYKSTLDAKKETIENIEEAIEKYESTYSDYQNTLDTLLDKHYEEIENAVNQFNAEIDVHLELYDAEKEWNDFWKDVVEDVEDTDFAGQVAASMKQLSTLIGLGNFSSNGGKVGELTKHVGNTTAEVWKQINGAENGGGDSIFGDDTALSKETLTNYMNQLMTSLRDAEAEVDNIGENYLNILDKSKEILEDQKDMWEAIGNHIDHKMKMIEMIEGSEAFEDLEALGQERYQNNLNNIETNRMAVETYQRQMQEEQAMMATLDKSSKEYKIHSEAYEKASENYLQAVEDLDKSLEDTVTQLQEDRERELNNTLKTLDKALSGGMGIDSMTNQWKLVVEMQDYYLDNIERSIEMQSLQGEFSDVIESYSTQASVQKELIKFQDEEIAKLEEKNKLTQYDIDEVKARFEIKKAELALEEAQRNKSNMRLRRDSQGNYTYQYTANQDAIDEANNGILTAKKEWWELVKKRNEENTNQLLEVTKNYYQAVDDYAKAKEANDKQAMADALMRQQLYEQQMKDLTAESEKAKQDLFVHTGEIFEGVTGAEEGGMLEMWGTTIQTMTDEWYKNPDSFIKSVEQGIKDIDAIQAKFIKETEDAFAKAGRSLNDYRKNSVDPTTESLKKMAGTNEDLKKKMEDNNKELEDTGKKLHEAEAAYNDYKNAAVEALTAAQEAYKKLAETVVKSNAEIEASNIKAAESAKNLSVTPSGAGFSGGGNTASPETPPSTETVKKYTVWTSQNGTGRYYVTDIYGDLTTMQYGSRNDVIKWLRDTKKVKGSEVNWDHVSGGAAWFKSGGYTGDWSNESGKLAVLHQKELVLNEADTANLLKAVSLIRTLVGVANSADFNRIANSVVGAGSTSAQLANSVSSGALQSIASNVTNNSNISNTKDVTINADFSGVRSADEIYKALTELQNYNLQSLYA